MMKYFFILGKNPDLSIAEILAVLSLNKIQFNLLETAGKFLVLGTERVIEPALFIKKLGGTIKIGQVFERDKFDLPSILEIITQERLLKTRKKFYFGFSVYSDKKAAAAKLNNQIKKLAFALKNELKAQKISSRWVTSREKVLSSVVVEKNKLLEQGIEIVVLSDEKFFLGRTVAVQEFEEYGLRDFGKPQRDILSGMLPPKLAKMMINFTQVEASQGGKILDPFCGTGTIISEALALGYQNLICSDIRKKAIENAQANQEWLAKEMSLIIPEKQIQYLAEDVRNLDKKIKLGEIEAIVTEPHLGPLLRGNESFERINKVIEELSQLYLEAFKVFKKILKKNGRVVIIFPVFSIQNKDFFIPVIREIEELGFKNEPLLPKDLLGLNFVGLTERKTLIYFRPGQKVKREIIKFILK